MIAAAGDLYRGFSVTKEERLTNPVAWIQAADDLTDPNFSKFDEKHRIPLDPAKLDFLVLGELNQAAGELYKDLLKEKENKLSFGSSHNSATPKRKVTERLK